MSVLAAKELAAVVDSRSDDEIWHLAILFVGFAGHRAVQRERDDVNTACHTFVEAMHELVGTPKPKDQSHAG
jgi:hypothetical protein